MGTKGQSGPFLYVASQCTYTYVDDANVIARTRGAQPSACVHRVEWT